MFSTRLYSYVYGIGKPTDSTGYFDQIIKINLQTGANQLWKQKGCYPSRPLFIPMSNQTTEQEEDDGMLLSIVLDSNEKKSFLLILNAKTLEEVGRALLPHHIPFTIGATWS